MMKGSDALLTLSNIPPLQTLTNNLHSKHLLSLHGFLLFFERLRLFGIFHEMMWPRRHFPLYFISGVSPAFPLAKVSPFPCFRSIIHHAQHHHYQGSTSTSRRLRENLLFNCTTAPASRPSFIDGSDGISSQASKSGGGCLWLHHTPRSAASMALFSLPLSSARGFRSMDLLLHFWCWRHGGETHFSRFFAVANGREKLGLFF
jgi:hypothetical protein